MFIEYPYAKASYMFIEYPYAKASYMFIEYPYAKASNILYVYRISYMFIEYPYPVYTHRARGPNILYVYRISYMPKLLLFLELYIALQYTTPGRGGALVHDYRRTKLATRWCVWPTFQEKNGRGRVKLRGQPYQRHSGMFLAHSLY